MFCEECGAKLPEGAKVCYNCGSVNGDDVNNVNNVNNVNQANTSNEVLDKPKNRKMTMILIVALAIAICVIIALLIIVLNGDNKSKETQGKETTATVGENETTTEQETTTEEISTEETTLPKNTLDEKFIKAYVGSWGDSYSQRAYMDILCEDGESFTIKIRWGSGASYNSEWVLEGKYSEEEKGILYEGTYNYVEYADNGDVNILESKEAKGLLYIKEDSIYWDDRTADEGNNCKFEKME